MVLVMGVSTSSEMKWQHSKRQINRLMSKWRGKTAFFYTKALHGPENCHWKLLFCRAAFRLDRFPCRKCQVLCK